MSVKIRFTRLGKPKNPFYRVIVTDSRRPRDSVYLDKVGHFNPLIKKEDRTKINFHLDKEKIISWLKKGAQPTQVVKDLIKEEKIWSEFISEKSKPKKTKKRKSRSHPISEMLKRREDKKKIEEIRKKGLKKKDSKEVAEKVKPASEEEKKVEKIKTEPVADSGANKQAPVKENKEVKETGKKEEEKTGIEEKTSPSDSNS